MTMSNTIGGKLDRRALARLHFNVLDRSQQEQAIRRLSNSGMSDYGISHATGLSTEQIRRVLGENRSAP